MSFLHKNRMFIGMTYQVLKMLKMLLNKQLSCRSDFLKYSKAEENHGQEFYYMAPQEQEKHF